MKRLKWFLVVPILLFSWSYASLCLANTSATVVRDTQLKSKPDIESEAIVDLKKSTKVDVTSREGGWYQVSIPEYSGWVRMFLIRFEPVNMKEGRSGLGALLASTKKPHSDVTMTTGVRGITEKGIKNAKPNFVLLGKMSGYKSEPNEATRFANQEGLQARKVEYVKQEGKK